jgi:NAD-reducing hydrogenase large subunit
MDVIVGARQLTPTAEKLRRLMHYGQILQSHALHFFHLCSPDLLFGFDSDFGASATSSASPPAHPEIARQGVLLRKFGQEVIRITAGKRIHGTGAVPGGVNKSLTAAERDELRRRRPDGRVESARSRWSSRLHADQPALYNSFGEFDSRPCSGPGARDGAMDLYDGGLRARDADGALLFDHLDYARYGSASIEEAKPWSYMKFPYLRSLGRTTAGIASARWRGCRTATSIPTPLAEIERRSSSPRGGKPNHAPLAYHWARMIEMLHAAELIKDLLHDDEILGTDSVASGEPSAQEEGVGVIEAPRGTLIHHYRVDETTS